MKFYNKVVIVGATSVIAQHCARLLADNGSRTFILVGRNHDKLQTIKDDLLSRSNLIENIEIKTLNFTEPAEIQNVINETCDVCLPDLVLIAHGYMPSQEVLGEDISSVKTAIEINGVSPVMFSFGYAERLKNSTESTIATIGSVAGDRGRMTNYVYGAGKGLIEVFMQGLTHRFGIQGPRICLIKPGPTRTSMTSHISPKKLANPDEVAKDIIQGISKGKHVIYTPRKWWFIMLIVKMIPDCIFKYIKI